jgi:hypothetical protein
MAVELPELLSRFFDATDGHDVEGLVALFSDGATLVDEGATRHGLTEIRAWAHGPAMAYNYSTSVLSAEAIEADRHLVTGRLTGDFPGGSADLTWDFTIADEHVTRLVIAP